MGEGTKRRSSSPLPTRDKNPKRRKEEEEEEYDEVPPSPPPPADPDSGDEPEEEEEEIVHQGAHKLKRMVLQNFMCHRLLELEFGDRITFITGKNGSGKSATMNALTAVFGGKQTDTGKKGSVVGWIRRGPTGRQQKATIKITISNEGPNPYKFETYGSDITFERQITASSSSYYLTGTISRREKVTAAQVKLIANYFKIQATNPFTIMTQETIKNFMKGNPKKLYEHFSRGTSIDELKSSYNEMRDNWEVQKAKQQRRVTDLKEHKKFREEAVGKLKLCERKREAQARQLQLDSLEKWTEVPVVEAQLRKAKKKVSDYQNLYEQVEDREKDKQAEISQLDVGVEERDRVRLQAEANDFKNQVNELLKEQKKQEAEQNKDIHFKSKLEEDIAHAERKITNCKRQLKSYKDNPVVEKQAQLEEARHANREVLEEMKREMTEEVEPSIKVAKDDLERMQSNIDGARAATLQGEKRIHELERERDEIKRRSSAKENKFGAYAKEIGQKINMARWNKLPVGPIGNHIDVHDSYQKYAGVVEKQLGGTLHGYIVFTLEDKMKLTSIIKSITNNVPSIYQQDFVSDSFRNRRSFKEAFHTRYPSALKVLKINHLAVENLLISWSQLNYFLLCDNEEIAQDIAQSEASNPGGSNYPSVLTTRGGEFKYRSGVSGGSNELVARYLSESNDFQSITDQNARDLGQARREHEAYKNDFKKWQGRAGQKKAVIRQKELMRATLNKKIEDCTRKDQQFDKQLRDLVVNTDGRHAQLITEIQHSQAEIDAKKAQLEGIEERMEYAQRKIDEKKEVAAREGEMLNKRMLELEALEARTLRRENEAKQLEKELKEIKGAKKDVEVKIVEKKADVERLKKEVDNVVRIAESHCERPTNPLTKQLLKDEREKISRDLKLDVKSSDKDYEDIKRSAEEAAETYQKKKDNLKARQKATGKIEAAVRIRLSELQSLVKDQAERVSNFFSYICRGNKYEGECKIIPETFDLNAKSQSPGSITINMSKIVGDQKIDMEALSEMGKNKGNTATLSGGERSISTVILLIAIWHATSSPFRCIDEFDVYMDAHHKHMATHILCRYAETNPGAQVIFLTPQGLSNDQKGLRKQFGDIFQFLKMKDPTRAEQN